MKFYIKPNARELQPVRISDERLTRLTPKSISETREERYDKRHYCDCVFHKNNTPLNANGHFCYFFLLP